MSQEVLTKLLQDDIEENREDSSVELFGSIVVNIIKEFDKEDNPDRERFIPFIRRNLLYWRGVQHLFWDALARDYRTTLGLFATDGSEDFDLGEFNNTINVFRAHGESIVAALSAGTPYVRFTPDDADNADDLAAVEEYDKAAELIQIHNEAPLLFTRMNYTYYNQGMVAVYTYHKKSKEYGTYQKDIHESVTIPREDNYCPECGADINDSPSFSEPQEAQDGSVSLVEKRNCDLCGPQTPYKEIEDEVYTYIVGQEERPKGRECIEVYGPLNVLIPVDARCQKKIPYLIFEEEVHEVFAKEMFPEYAEVIGSGQGSGAEDFYRFARRLLFEELANDKRVTIRHVWIRPCAYLKTEDATILKEQFPDGIHAIIIREKCVFIENQNLDSCWTISSNPTSDYLHAHPPASDMADMQDIENDLGNLTLQTIFHGIPQNFADPQVLDFDAFATTENKVGQYFPAEGRTGQPIGNSFYQTKSATLSREVDTFRTEMNKKSQFVSGDMPSIHGGPNNSGSKTLGEYEQSRAQALQRLSITLRTMTSCYKKAISKSVYSYCAHLKEEGYTDRAVKRGLDQKFSNVTVDPNKLHGKVGGVEPETNEQFPITWEQQRNLIMMLMDKGNPAINAAIFHPNNIDYVQRLIGLRELHIPGKEDVVKQLEEIRDIQSGMPVEIDVELDDHLIHAQVIKAFLLSNEGLKLKREQPDIYMAELNHYKQHAMILQQQAMVQQGGQPAMGPNQPAGPATSAEPVLPAPGEQAQGPQINL